ncbi:MAG: HlyC/CorC family transporter [Deltaproteobacteria bacterium]|nr:HlyC/CorC family transporter [Deltaproteobacteria bacterium]
MDSFLYHSLLIAMLLVLSAVFSATETALLSLGEAGVHRILEDEKRKSRLLLLWRDNPNQVLTSLLIANNLVNILASAIATALAAQMLADAGVTGQEGFAVAAAVGVMTFLIVMFGEIIPKTFARNNSERLLPFFPVTLAAFYLFRPFSSIFQGFTNRLIRAFGASAGEPGPTVTEAEVEAMIRLGTAEGAISGEKKEMLSSVIEFSDTMIMEIMVPRTDVVGFPVDASRDEVVKTVEERKFSRYPVYSDDIDSIVGILTVKDLMRYLADPDPGPFSLKAMVSSRVLIVPETKKIGKLLSEFQREHVQMAVAVDEYGGTAGIVTTEDIIEEIVGEIYDEHDRTEEDVRELGDGRYLVLARTPIDRLEDLFGIDLPEQDIYETVGGLVLTEAGQVLKSGEVVEFAGLRFEVRERTRTRILNLLVTRIQPEGPDEAGNDNGGRGGK